MSKISMQQFDIIMGIDVIARNICIEIEFCINEDPEYDSCWLGKTGVTVEEIKYEVFWYGLVADGSQAYEYYSAEEFSNAPVFRGKSIKDLWDKVIINSIDGCSVEYRLPYYLGL